MKSVFEETSCLGRERANISASQRSLVLLCLCVLSCCYFLSVCLSVWCLPVCAPVCQTNEVLPHRSLVNFWKVALRTFQNKSLFHYLCKNCEKYKCSKYFPNNLIVNMLHGIDFFIYWKCMKACFCPEKRGWKVRDKYKYTHGKSILWIDNVDHIVSKHEIVSKNTELIHHHLFSESKLSCIIWILKVKILTGSQFCGTFKILKTSSPLLHPSPQLHLYIMSEESFIFWKNPSVLYLPSHLLDMRLVLTGHIT